jgi:hypothetical protein
MENKKQQIANLLQQTGNDHHAAYIETDGYHPDWPLWYAEYLHGRLPPLLGQELTISELAYLMVDLDRQYRAQKPVGRWYEYYAAELLRRYHIPDATAPESENGAPGE